MKVKIHALGIPFIITKTFGNSRNTLAENCAGIYIKNQMTDFYP